MHQNFGHYKVAKKARLLVTETWQSEASLSVLLALLVLVIFVLPLTELVNRYFSWYVDVSYSLLLLFGLTLAWYQRRAFYAMLIVAIVSVAVRWASWWNPQLCVFREATMLASILVATYIVVSLVFRTGRVTSVRIKGALAVYLLFGLGWAHAYQLVSYTNPSKAFASQVPLLTVSAWIYYSLVTLTTLGYGDIVPVSRVARMLAVGEAVTGQLYLTVLVARLVALQVAVSNGPKVDDSLTSKDT
jgi:hypothetical protein